jgi:hypothetical protein
MAKSAGPAKGKGAAAKGVAKHGGKHRKKFTKGGKGSVGKNPHTKKTKKGTRAAGMAQRNAGKV